jgi:hypothetical protein
VQGVTLYRAGTVQQLDFLTLEKEPIRFSETSVKDYKSTLRNTPEERVSQQ